MAENCIKITVVAPDNQEVVFEAPTDMGLSLMEFLKAAEYDILATCGGMALCATCCVDILEGAHLLPNMEDAEENMLDTLPNPLLNSRLSCQLPINLDMDGLRLRLHQS